VNTVFIKFPPCIGRYVNLPNRVDKIDPRSLTYSKEKKTLKKICLAMWPMGYIDPQIYCKSHEVKSLFHETEKELKLHVVIKGNFLLY
jgi:hypothetical protein